MNLRRNTIAGGQSISFGTDDGQRRSKPPLHGAGVCAVICRLVKILMRYGLACDSEFLGEAAVTAFSSQAAGADPRSRT